MTIVEGMINGLILIVAFLGLIILTGFIIAIINNLFYKIVKNNSYGVCLATGFIGTPIHEIGHALFCIIFFHKITEIKLFQKDSKDGTLGYVAHSYNPKNPYQVLGNFFIGVGPILFGSGIILLLLFLLNKPSFVALNGVMKFFVTQVPEDISMYPKFIMGGISVFIEQFFSIESLKSFTWWILILICLFISLHMRLSKADINGAFSGLLLSAIVLFLIPTITSFFGFDALSKLMGKMLGIAAYLGCVYLLSIVLAMVTLVFAIPLRLILNKKSKKHRKKGGK